MVIEAILCHTDVGTTQRFYIKTVWKDVEDAMKQLERKIYRAPRALEWIDENVQPDAQWFGITLVVEHRYAWALAQGMTDERLVLA